MTGAEYARIRGQIGSQRRVSDLLAPLHLSTISRRERGELPIDKEAEYAMRYLLLRANGEIEKADD